MLKKTLYLLRNHVKTLKHLIYNRFYITPELEKNIVDQFHKLYYDSYLFDKTWSNTFWLGIPIQKCPLDLWIYQEMIFEIKPDVIIECGTANGGGALFLACMLDIVNNGEVITIDIEDTAYGDCINSYGLPVYQNYDTKTDINQRPTHKRIKYLLGSSTSGEIVEQVRKLLSNKKVMVILDSDHHKEHVLNELRAYSKFVTKGSYIIVEDTNLNSHPIAADFGPGPMEAVEDFLKENKDFIIDNNKEKFHLTFNPKGFLQRIRVIIFMVIHNELFEYVWYCSNIY